MKKHIAKELTELAEVMPMVFETKIGTTLMSGAELNLTPLGEKQRFDKNKMYSVPVPELHAVEHRQQLKDAYKRGGMDEVKRYAHKVMEEAKNGQLTHIAN